MRSVSVLASLFLITIFLAGCSVQVPEATSAPATQSESVRVWPGKEWLTSPPEKQGIDPGQLTRMHAAIEQEKLNLHSLLIARNGYLVFEAYFPPYQQDSRHELFSVTKSFISTLVGIALEQGYIHDLGQPVSSFFPGQSFANPDPRKEKMTLEHLLTMTSGLSWEEGDTTYRQMYLSPDWVHYVLDIPMLAEPGSSFNYCSGCSHLLSAILQEATGMNTLDFAKKVLFQPLGITDFTWETDANEIPIGGWGLRITPRDMARLGILYLNRGNWDGKEIVPAEWVEASVEKHIETGGELDYGYQWWIYPSHGAYAALGRAGQTILVVPDLDLVIVTTAEIESHEIIFNLVEEYILPATKVEQ